ncbi:MAG TPA: hypothetical protein VM943_05575 [Pyrinomonadaceae bacterium]|nr:hypothetical protein [Pyrinomonadaceae bacterium]
MSSQKNNSRRAMPYRVLSVLIMGAFLALLLAAFYSAPQPLTSRTLLLLLAGVSLLVLLALEIVYRDTTRLSERVRLLEKNRE